MANNEPVVLDLALLPREQVGPFLLLGIDKTADKDTIDASWAERLKWARRNQLKISLEDINWAKDVLADNEKRLRMDAASMNADLADNLVARLAARFGATGGQVKRLWQPLDVEKPLAEYEPPGEVPPSAEVRAALEVPPMPADLPGVPAILEAHALQAVDAWAVQIP